MVQTKETKMNNLSDIQEQTILAVEKAAVFIQHEIGKIHQSDIETKALNSLVTYVDKEAEKILVTELQKIISNATFLTVAARTHVYGGTGPSHIHRPYLRFASDSLPMVYPMGAAPRASLRLDALALLGLSRLMSINIDIDIDIDININIYINVNVNIYNN